MSQGVTVVSMAKIVDGGIEEGEEEIEVPPIVTEE